MKYFKIKDNKTGELYIVNSDTELSYAVLVTESNSCFVKPIANDVNNFTEVVEGATPQEIENTTKEVVPERVTAIQFLSALALAGITESQVNSVIESLPEPNKTIASIAFKRATVFERANSFISLIALSFDMTETDVDTIFINANKIEI